jgi:uncharacterized membrane protein
MKSFVRESAFHLGHEAMTKSQPSSSSAKVRGHSFDENPTAGQSTSHDCQTGETVGSPRLRVLIAEATGIALLHFAIGLYARLALGVNISADTRGNTWDYFSQTLPGELLRDDLWSSIWLLHAQPPLYNLLGGLTIKFFPNRYPDVLHTQYMLLGAIMVGLLYVVLYQLTSNRLYSVVVGVLLALYPAILLYEAYFLYSLPVAFLIALSVAMLSFFSLYQKNSFLIAFIFCINILILTRSAYHILLLVPAMAVAWLAVRTEPQRVLTIAFLICLLSVGWYSKNQVQFGFWGSSSWVGMNLFRAAEADYGNNELKALADEGVIDELTGYVKPMARPSVYSEFGYATNSEQPALAGDHHNNQIILTLSPIYMRNAVKLIAHDPMRYANGVAGSILKFAAPSSRYPHLAANAASLGIYESFVSQILLGQRLFPHEDNEPEGSILLFLMPLSLLLYGYLLQRKFRQLWPAGNRLDHVRRQLAPDIAIHFMFLIFAYTLAVGILFEHGENERFKFMIEPIWWVFFATVMYQTVRLYRNRQSGGSTQIEQVDQRAATGPHPYRRLATAIALVFVIALSAWLRWLYVADVGLHVDEFSTLWGSRQVMNSGLPLMPSGVLYTRGLFSTYLIAAAGKLFGLTIIVGRMPSLIFGVLAVMATFFLGRRSWNERVGWLAAILLALLPEAIEASGRARFYAPLSLWSLLAVGILFLAVRHQPNGQADNGARYRNHILFGLFFSAALFSQEATILLYPSLLICLVWWRGFRYLLKPPVLLGQGLAMAAIGLRLAIELFGQPGQIEVMQSNSPYLSLAFDISGAWQVFAQPFISPLRLPITLAALLAVVVALIALRRKQWHLASLSNYHQATLWYATQYTFVMVLLLTLVGEVWRRPRYVFFIQQLWLLTGTAGIIWLVDRLLPGKVARWIATLGLTALAVVAMWPDAIGMTRREMLGYEQGFVYVMENRQPDDIVMTPQVAGCAFVFDRPCDYYMSQERYEPFVVKRDGMIVDRWSGAPLLNSVEQLESVSQSSDRVWMIIDGDRLATAFQPDFTALVEEQFQQVFRSGKTSVLLSESWREIPEYTVSEQFDSPFGWPNLALVGWERSDAMTSPLAVRLYWTLLGDVDDDTHTSLQLVAQDGSHLAQADGPLDRGMLSLGDIEERPFPEFKELVLPEVEPGLYRLDVVAYDIDDREPIDLPISVGWLRIGEVVSPRMEPLGATWSDGMVLDGHSSLPESLLAGEPLALTLGWRTERPLEQDYTVFVHLIGPDGAVAGQQDKMPLNGFYPTSRWPASAHESGEELLIDQYEILLPEAMETGDYRLHIGWYDATTGERQRTVDGDDFVELGNWQVP